MKNYLAGFLLVLASLSARAGDAEWLSAPLPKVAPVAGSGHSVGPILSPTASHVIFSSLADDMVPGMQANRHFDVFIKNLSTGVLRLVSVAPDGSAANGDSVGGGISRDNRFIVFQSAASNLVEGGDSNGRTDIFFRELGALTNGIVTRGGNGDSTSPQISEDSEWIVFTSLANNLGVADTNGVADIYSWRRSTRAMRLVSGNAAGASRNVSNLEYFMLPDSVSVLFMATGPNLVTGVTNVTTQLYLRNLSNNVLTLASAQLTNASAGAFTNATLVKAVPSLDGRSAALVVRQTNGSFLNGLFRLSLTNSSLQLVTNDVVFPHAGLSGTFGPCISSNGQFIVYSTGSSLNSQVLIRWNAVSGAFQAVDPATGTGTADSPVMSPDGAKVAFMSTRANVATNLTGSGRRLYLRNFTTGTTRLISRGLDAYSFFNGGFNAAVFTFSNSHLIFDTPEENYVAGDGNGYSDIYQWSDINGAFLLISSNNNAAASVASLGPRWARGVSADGSRVAFHATAQMSASDTNENSDVYVFDRELRTNLLVSARTDGLAPTSGVSHAELISADGRRVIFQTSARALAGSGDTRPGNIYVRDVVAASTIPVIPTTSSGFFSLQSLSGNGNFLFYSLNDTQQFRFDITARTNLLVARSTLPATAVTGDGQIASYGSGPTFIYDFLARASNFVTGAPYLSEDGSMLALRQSASIQFSNRFSHFTRTLPIATDRLVFSADGRFAAFELRQSLRFIVLLDVLTGKTNLISRRFDTGLPSTGGSARPAISADGRFVAFEGTASDLVADDDNLSDDVFLYDRFLDRLSVASHAAGRAKPGNAASFNPVLSADGSTLIFHSLATDLAPGSGLNPIDVYALTIERATDAADTDADGLPDIWEREHFSSLDFSGTDDFDGDGADNRNEFVSETNPTDASSAFLIQSVEVSAAGERRITWRGGAGRAYVMQWKATVENPDWNNLTDNIVATGQAQVTLDSASTTQRFYRLMLIP